ncbi:MAG TPA: DUF4105 domain-containing protein [Puia sp.]|jgi:hypothetical protein
MKQFYLSLGLALLLTVTVRAGEVVLSPFCRVSVLTCDPGREPYAIFGHSAIRVRNSLSDLDVVFNYGTFDFDDPHFYDKFLRGRLTYFLGITSFKDFLPEYKDDHQRVREQVLNMQPEEIQRLWDRLQENLKEENRYYKYDFFYDNCSTRIREDIKWIYGDRLRTDDWKAGENRSFRQEITSYFIYNSWTGFGIDLCLGLSADKRPSPDERMFLPWNLYDALAFSSIDHGQSVVSATVVYDFSNAGSVPTALERHTPLVVCWILLATGLLIVALEAKYRRKWVFFDGLLFTLTGLVGVALFCLWCFTDHSVTKWNQNLLWASPLNLIAVWAGARLKRAYFFVYSIVLAGLLLWFLVAAYYFDMAVLPLVLLLLVRSIITLLQWPATFQHGRPVKYDR